jgi:hypothetical protein
MEIFVGSTRINVTDKAIADLKAMSKFGFNLTLEQVIISSYASPMRSDIADYHKCIELSEEVGIPVYVGYSKLS